MAERTTTTYSIGPVTITIDSESAKATAGRWAKYAAFVLLGMFLQFAMTTPVQ